MNKLVILGAFLLVPVAGANVKFLAIGRPSAIRIEGRMEPLTAVKTEWKDGRFSGTYRIPVTSLDSGISLRDKHAKEKYLETEKFPDAEYILEGCPLKVGETDCGGNLTLHGVTKPVTIKVIASDGGPSVLKVKAEFGIKLSDYGIAIPKFANVTVADTVDISVESEAKKP